MYSKIKYIFYLLIILFLLFPKNIFAQVVINEFVVDGDDEWVELYNASDSAEYLKNYYIDDDDNFTSDSGNSGKKSLSSLNITNINFPYLDLSSSIFNNTPPDSVVLFDNLGNILDSYSYNINPGKEISIGRSPDRTGDFVVLISTTKGSVNSQKAPTPSPTATATPTPTTIASPTPKPTPTKTPSPKPTPTLTSTPIVTIKPQQTIEPLIVLNTKTPIGKVAGASTTKKSPILAIILIISGISFLGYGGYLLYNMKNAKNKEIG